MADGTHCRMAQIRSQRSIRLTRHLKGAVAAQVHGRADLDHCKMKLWFAAQRIIVTCGTRPHLAMWDAWVACADDRGSQIPHTIIACAARNADRAEAIGTDRPVRTAAAARLRKMAHMLCERCCVGHIDRLRAVLQQVQPDGLCGDQERGCCQWQEDSHLHCTRAFRAPGQLCAAAEQRVERV